MIRVWLDGASDHDEIGARSLSAEAPEETLALSASDDDVLERIERFVRGRLAVALLGYDLGRAIERVPSLARDDHGLPDVWLAAFPDARLSGRLDPPPVPAPEVGPLGAEMTYEAWARGVTRALEHIRAGDCYQVNLSHRLFAEVGAGDRLGLYQRLRHAAPAPLGAFIDAGEFQLLSNSPELFLRYESLSRTIETRPIKGTRPRGATPELDAALARELTEDAKERAEHVMIVDLLRNDLGRICEPGSVGPDGALHRVVSLPTVHHAISTLRGTVRPGVNLAAILRATFPGGSVTGAPKVAAMRIIEEIEPVRRGPYTGAIGVFEPDGSFTLSVAIRTAVIRSGLLRVHVGGGIVADSTPEREWAETWDKAAAFVALQR